MNREKLEAAIHKFSEIARALPSFAPEIEALVEASTAHLATLPEPPKKVTLGEQVDALGTALAQYRTGSELRIGLEAASESLRAIERTRSEWRAKRKAGGDWNDFLRWVDHKLDEIAP